MIISTMILGCDSNQKKKSEEPNQKSLHKELTKRLYQDGIIVFINNSYLFGGLANVEMGNDTILCLRKDGTGMSYSRTSIESTPPMFKPDLSIVGRHIEGTIREGLLSIDGKRLVIYQEGNTFWIKPQSYNSRNKAIPSHERLYLIKPSVLETINEDIKWTKGKYPPFILKFMEKNSRATP